MKFLLSHHKYVGGGDYDIVPYQERPEFENYDFPVTGESYRESHTWTQNRSTRYNEVKQEINGEIWHKKDPYYEWSKMPDMSEWIDVKVIEVDERTKKYTYQLELHDWFIEINTVEDLAKFMLDTDAEILMVNQHDGVEVFGLRIHDN